MSGRDSLSPTRRQPPREKRSSNEMLPPVAAEPSKRFRTQPQEDMQLHSDAMQQPTGHAQQLPGADKTDDDLAAEAGTKVWASRIDKAQSNEARRRWATQGRERDPSRLQRGTSIDDLLAPPNRKMGYGGKVPSMADAQPFLQQTCCALPKPMGLDDGSWICLHCGLTSAELNKRTIAAMARATSEAPLASDQAHAADWDTDMPLPLPKSCCLMPYRQTGDQEQILCDSCGGVFFDEDANKDDSLESGSGGLTFRGTSSMGLQNSFEIANQGTGAQKIMDEDGHSFFAGGHIDEHGSSDGTYFRRYGYLTQSSSSSSTNYQPPVNLGPRIGPHQEWIESRRSRRSRRARSTPATPDPEVDTSTQETEEHEDKPSTMVSNVPIRTRQPSASELVHCITCMEKDDIYNVECTLCHKCHSEDHTTIECMVDVPKFHKFMDLAFELREPIYAFALDTDRFIKPHLCDYPTDEAIQFHDDNQKDHFATSDLLGITRVNKQIRAETLPIFYSANTFEVGPDTTTYLDRLAYLGRFDMIRHVRFSIGTRNESMSPGILRRMNQYIKEADAFERDLAEPLGQRLLPLKRHPQYIYGGVPELNTLITLMKLTSSLTSEGKGKGKADTTFHSKLVVPIPSVSAFTSYDRLKWFPTVMYGLGIQVHYVENVPFSSVPGSTVEITWHQRFQKKEFGDIPDYVNPVDSSGQTAAYMRALELDPELEQKQRPRAWAYLRTTCVGGNSDWFDIPTEGGGVGYGR